MVPDWREIEQNLRFRAETRRQEADEWRLAQSVNTPIDTQAHLPRQWPFARLRQRSSEIHARGRATILRLVAEGRMSTDEAKTVLEAMGVPA